jgi:hypothetical protein
MREFTSGGTDYYRACCKRVTTSSRTKLKSNAALIRRSG